MNPTENPMDCVCFNLRRASRMMTQVYEQYLRDSGLTNAQFSLLMMAIKVSPISITDLADALAMDRTTLTRNLRLVREKSLLRVVAGKDGRTKNVEVTAKGRKAIEKALPLWEKAQTRVVEELGEKNWRALLKDLNAVTRVAASVTTK